MSRGRVLLINPNTSLATTEMMARLACAALRTGDEMSLVRGRSHARHRGLKRGREAAIPRAAANPQEP